jgi:hypothetical protein
MAKKPWDDILKGVMQASKKGSASTAKKSVASTAKKAAGSTMSRAERSAANKAKAAADRAARMKAGSEASAAMRAARKEKNRAEAIAGDLREMNKEWTRGTQIRKAREFFGEEVDKALSREQAAARVLVPKSQAKRDYINREIKKFQTYMEREGYGNKLTAKEIGGIVQDAMSKARKTQEVASKRVTQVVGQSKAAPKKAAKNKRKTGGKNPAEQEVITTAARRQYRKDLRRGTAGRGDDAAKTRDKQRQYDEQTKTQKKTLDNAKAGTGPARKAAEDSKKRVYRERGAERYPEAQRYKDMPKKLREQMEANAKKGQSGLSKAERDKRFNRFKQEQEAMRKPRKPKAREFDRYGNRITPKGK